MEPESFEDLVKNWQKQLEEGKEESAENLYKEQIFPQVKQIMEMN